ncbi:unnamed protein product, partial [Heligmosomoides polygyrus]|uniref:Anaphase-promoting complex subunit 11 n=1 Tax=Heligmosomoides polygyrus TaxID=6339 RepID=A0A183GMK3_HELPZ
YKTQRNNNDNNNNNNQTRQNSFEDQSEQAVRECHQILSPITRFHCDLQVTAEWKWTEGGDDTCGICRMPFEACCVDCKCPGDDCPLVLGQCRHPFHSHCIAKWTEAQNTPKPQCPLCRQEWKLAD